MRRGIAPLLIACLALLAAAHSLQAGQPTKYPPRYKRESVSQYYAYKTRAGQIRVRQVYAGYREHFPPPAFLYYGYPHSGDDTGPGFPRQW